jgi:hypothetical protein
MNPPPPSRESHFDLCRTQRRFLLAREQTAAQGSAARYFAVQAMRGWPQGAGRGAHGPTDAPDHRRR